MKVAISKLPDSGWWSKGMPKYNDNPAMIESAIPNLKLLNEERTNLKNVILQNGHDVIEFDFPDELDKKEPKHDFIFIRDSFISDQNGTAVILSARQPTRRIENTIVKKYLRSLNMDIIQMPNSPDLKADGGEFYLCKKDNILFSGLKRNSLQGAQFVAEQLKVKSMVLIEGEGFHLDTYFTPALNKRGRIAALIVCLKIISDDSRKRITKIAKKLNVPIFDIPPDDAIGSEEKIGSFAANALPLPGVLVHPNRFSDKTIGTKLLNIGIEQVITPTSQFQLSGGSVHCLTNEI